MDPLGKSEPVIKYLPSPAISSSESSGINEQIQQIARNYEVLINAYLKSRDWKSVYSNKYLFHIFFNRLMSKSFISASEQHQLLKYEYSCSSIAYNEFLDSLNYALKSPHLNEESKRTISSLITSLRNSLDFAFIIDGIRAQNPTLVKMSQGGKEVTKRELQNLNQFVDQKEVDILVNKIILDIKNLHENDYFQCVSGTAIHDTQIMIQKKEDGSYTFYHYDPSPPYPEKTVSQISGIDETTITNPSFWKQVMNTKLSGLEATPLYNAINKLGKKDDPRSISRQAIRHMQEVNVCSFESIFSLLRHQLVENSSKKNEGAKQFKILKSLFNENAIQKTKGKKYLDPLVWEIAKQKEIVTHRRILWEEAVSKGDFEKVKQAFAEHMEQMGFDSGLEEIEGKTPTQALETLHRLLVDCLIEKEVDKEMIHAILDAEESSLMFEYLKPSYASYLFSLPSY